MLKKRSQIPKISIYNYNLRLCKMEIDDFLLIFQNYKCLIHFNNIFITSKVPSPTLSSKLKKLKNKKINCKWLFLFSSQFKHDFQCP